MLDNRPCENCIYIGYSSCGEGYCCSTLRAKQSKSNLVIDDRGCLIKECEYYKNSNI